MNVLRCTVIDNERTASFILDCEAVPALVHACGAGPSTLEELLEAAEPYYGGLKDRVLNSLAVFAEHNSRQNATTIHRAFAYHRPEEQPAFEVIDERTREESLSPVKAGVVLFNLVQRRIVQIQNSWQEIRRTGRARVYKDDRATSRTYVYRLPREWGLVP